MACRVDQHKPRAWRRIRKLVRAGAAGTIALGMLVQAPAVWAGVARERPAVPCTPITTAQQFQAIGQNAATLAGYYCLQNDIDLSTLAAPFAPIGQTVSARLRARLTGRAIPSPI